MLAWQLCDFQGVQTSVPKKPYIFVIFQGGGGPSPLLLPLDPHMLVSGVLCDHSTTAKLHVLAAKALKSLCGYSDCSGFSLPVCLLSYNQMQFLYPKLVISSCDTENSLRTLYFCFREVLRGCFKRTYSTEHH